MAENVERTKEIDIWNANGAKSFVKCQTDWFSGEDSNRLFDSRLHLSFVAHTGKQNNCKQTSHIEMEIPMVKAGSDGQNSGTTALALAAEILNGVLFRKCEQAKNKAAADGKRYADDVWACIGGTIASRSKDGKAEFRKVSIAPGAKEGTVALKASRCEGGVSPKAGASWETIMVPVDYAYLETLAQVILTEWQAFRTAIVTRKMLGAPAESTHSTPAAAQVVEKIVEKRVEVPITSFESLFYISGLFDAKVGTVSVGIATTAAEAIQKAKLWLENIHEKYGFVQMNSNSFKALVVDLKRLENNNKDGFSTNVLLCRPESPTAQAGYLSVAVMKNVKI